MVYVLLGTGFEEVEAIAPVDLMRRAGIQVLTVGLNGKTVTDFAGVERNFGDGHADVETRLDILAHLEGVILSTGNYLPMLQDASASLLSQQVFYVVDEYNPVMGRGGIAYMKYNYNDADWVAYVASEGGELTY